MGCGPWGQVGGGAAAGTGQAPKPGAASALAAQCGVGDVDVAGARNGAHAVAELTLLDACAVAALADARLMGDGRVRHMLCEFVSQSTKVPL